jgi:serine/threonine-protein kinase
MEQASPTAASRVVRFGAGLIFLLTFGGALALARHNVRSGRGDRRGATRVALFVLGVMAVSWVLGARHSTELLTEFNRFRGDFLASQLVTAGTLWLVYVALEPYVRRYYPEILISWTRMLGGRFRDPRVGHDVLVGIAAGVGVAFLRFAYYLLPPLFGNPPPAPRPIDFEFLLGARNALSALLRMPSTALNRTMLITLTFVVMRVVVKRTWLAAIIAGAIFSFVVTGEPGTSDQLALNTALTLAVSALYMVVLVRYGVLAMVVAFFTNFVLSQGALTADLSKVYASMSVWLLALVGGLAVFGFYASRDREPLFGKVLDRT